PGRSRPGSPSCDRPSRRPAARCRAASAKRRARYHACLRGGGGMASSALARAFPKPSEIPERWRYTPSDVGLRLITGGGLALWQGASQEIRSAVCVRDDADRLAQLGLGPAAQANGAEGLAALESAATAWQGGRGEWPRASVEPRIEAIQAFT